ncbi:Ntn hydrolase family protein [Bacillus gobiensis]|uniref:Uncharacterized protein n=1 Tax=Bacillus gobiensis TaxID=1441095 RepID=A0A0M4FHD7_9BACI|nr:hypothetical protein [Bacillus gobiensis]ALC80454.1 hypothetical protein AM592_01790 [Bacillus gobiensis]
MSLITVVATKDFISIMSDGRLSDGENPVGEEYKKILKVSDKIIIGATGSHNQSKSLLSISSYWLNQSQGSIEIFANNIRKVILEDIPKSKFKRIDLHIVICGLNELNEIVFYVFTNDEKFAIEKVVMHQKVGYLALGKKGTVDKLEELINLRGYSSIDTIKEIQQEVNSLITEIDYSVNNNTFHEFISRTNNF